MNQPAPLVIRHSTFVIRHSTPRRRRGGFALLITITLLAFLVLLLVSLASLTRVETQVASNTQQLAQARQNALLALNIALGQLQKTAGPDQRVTARADITTSATHSWTPVTYDATASIITFPIAADYENARNTDTTAIESYWRISRNRRWTGVWRDSNYNHAPYDSDNPAASNPVPALQSWLVSGNENTDAGDTFKPTDTITGLTLASTPVDRILDSASRPHRLLVKASAGVTTSADLDRAVTAPEIEITATNIPGTDGSATPVGHYAWWVGDEGVKARANLVDPYAQAPSGETPAAKLTRETTRRQSAQRPAIEAMTTSGTDGLGTDYPANDPDLLNIFTSDQLAYISTATSFPTELKTRFHDLSVSSRGVLSDAKHGGLKQDLTYLLGQPSLTSFQTALRAAYGTNDIAPIPMPTSGTLGNALLTVTSTPYATLPLATPEGGGSYAAANIFRNSASWEQLWSFANQGASFNGAGQATPRLHTATQHGLYPLVIQTKLFFRMRIVGGAPDADGVNRTGILWVDTIPVILLANPYAVPLAPTDYQLRFNNYTPIPAGPAQLVFGDTDATDKPTTDFPYRAFTTEPSYMGNLTYVLRSTGMAAGEAQIFTIDPDANTLDDEDRFVITTSNDQRQVIMKNEFDPIPALTFNTAKTIPVNVPNPTPTTPPAPPAPPIPISRAALRVSAGGLVTQLYINYAASQGNLRLIQSINNQGTTEGTEGFGAGQIYALVVDPMADGIRQGGGIIAVLNQPPTTDHPASRKPAVAGTFFSHQQAPFLQVNYRTQRVTFTGTSDYPHPLEWGRRFTKNGSTGSVGTTPNPWIGANLLRPSGSTTTARWGIVNIGEGQNQTVPPASIGGASASGVGFNNYLYDIPRPGHPLSSLGQLQHFNTIGYIDSVSANDIHTWQVNYALSNSYPQPRVPRDQLFYKYHKSTTPNRRSTGYHYDGSYLWNDLLWDRFTFSTYPQTGAFDFTSEKLTNARFRPFRDTVSTPWNDQTKFRGDGNPATAANARAAASNLLVEGAFNINSTSFEAWKAVLSSLKKIPAGTESAPNAPFARTIAPLGGSLDAQTGISSNAWNGLRDLTTTQIESLAREMVQQVRKRGPFLSLSEFVNRRLSTPASDPLGLGLSGALQAALDRTVNLRENVAAAFRTQSSTRVDDNGHTTINEPAYILPTALAGFPGYVLQADVLSALGASLSARSDTFTIRTYGDSVNPVTKEVIGRAWCEAVVQRLPDYVEPAADAATAIPAATSNNGKFGRRFQIVSFRWLSPNDV